MPAVNYQYEKRKKELDKKKKKAEKERAKEIKKNSNKPKETPPPPVAPEKQNRLVSAPPANSTLAGGCKQWKDENLITNGYILTFCV